MPERVCVESPMPTFAAPGRDVCLPMVLLANSHGTQERKSCRRRRSHSTWTEFCNTTMFRTFIGQRVSRPFHVYLGLKGRWEVGVIFEFGMLWTARLTVFQLEGPNVG